MAPRQTEVATVNAYLGGEASRYWLWRQTRRFQLAGSGTDPHPPNLGYYEPNSGSHSAGDTTLGSRDLPF